MFPGQLPSVRRNIFNTLYVFDPSSYLGLEVGEFISVALSQRWTLRFGLVPFVPDNKVCFLDLYYINVN
jgi:hypothetical protein